MKKIETKKNP